MHIHKHTSRSTHSHPQSALLLFLHPTPPPHFFFPLSPLPISPLLRNEIKKSFFFHHQSGRHNYTNQQTRSSLCVSLTGLLFFSPPPSPSFQTLRNEIKKSLLVVGAMAQTSKRTPWTVPLPAIFPVSHTLYLLFVLFFPLSTLSQTFIFFPSLWGTISNCGDKAVQTFTFHWTKVWHNEGTPLLQRNQVID